jgi:uncharacterized protein (TIGR03437 family)
VLTVGGTPAKILFAGLTPTLTGLYQIDFIVPAGVHSGTVPVVLSLPAVSVYEAFGGISRYQIVPTSNSVQLAIQ